MSSVLRDLSRFRSHNKFWAPATSGCGHVHCRVGRVVLGFTAYQRVQMSRWKQNGIYGTKYGVCWVVSKRCESIFRKRKLGLGEERRWIGEVLPGTSWRMSGYLPIGRWGFWQSFYFHNFIALANSREFRKLWDHVFNEHCSSDIKSWFVLEKLHLILIAH